MAKTLYCWRCGTDIPMLEEQEWQEVSGLLQKGPENVKEYRRVHDMREAASYAAGEAVRRMWRHGEAVIVR